MFWRECVGQHLGSGEPEHPGAFFSGSNYRIELEAPGADGDAAPLDEVLGAPGRG